MKILCGTDFSPAARQAVEAALALAARTGGTLRLVHVVEDTGDTTVFEKRIREDAARLGADGVALDVAVLRGNADEVLTADAEHQRADLVVVGALGRRERPRWRLGSTADRVAQYTSCAVLVVRENAGLVSWARGGSTLRIVAGIDATPTSKAVLDWLPRLGAAGPCSVVGAHVYWPPEARDRLHLQGPIPIGEGHREVDTVIERELREKLGTALGALPMELRIVGGLGRVADHLVAIAEDTKADLLAIGSHQRSGFERLWHGSISHGVIDAAPMSVLCVPFR